MKWEKEKSKEEILKIEVEENKTYFGHFIKDGFPEYCIDWKNDMVSERSEWRDTDDPFSNYVQTFWSDTREKITSIKDYKVDTMFYLYLYQRHVVEKWKQHGGNVCMGNIEEEEFLKDIKNPELNQYRWVHRW